MRHINEQIIIGALLTCLFLVCVKIAFGNEHTILVRTIGPESRSMFLDTQYANAANIFERNTNIRLKRVTAGACSRRRLCIARSAHHEAYAPFGTYGNMRNLSIAGANSGHQFINAILTMLGCDQALIKPMFSGITEEQTESINKHIKKTNRKTRRAKRICKRKHNRITRSCIRRHAS